MTNAEWKRSNVGAPINKPAIIDRVNADHEANQAQQNEYQLDIAAKRAKLFDFVDAQDWPIADKNKLFKRIEIVGPIQLALWNAALKNLPH